jgi:hypothetical protein
MDLKGRAQEETGQNCLRNAYESLFDKTKRRGIVGELILATAFLLVPVLKKLDGRI